VLSRIEGTLFLLDLVNNRVTAMVFHISLNKLVLKIIEPLNKLS